MMQTLEMTTSDAQSVSTIDTILGEEGHLRRFARRLVRCDADVDDLVQETLMRAYCARDRFEPGTSVRAWTSTILRRLFLTSAIRTARRGVATETDANDCLDYAAAPSASSADGTTTAAAVESFDDDLKAALDRVPEVYRQAFCMSTIEEYSCAEIAERLKVPKGTVMSRIHRARESIRHDLLEARRATTKRVAPAGTLRRIGSALGAKMTRGPRRIAS